MMREPILRRFAGLTFRALALKTIIGGDSSRCIHLEVPRSCCTAPVRTTASRGAAARPKSPDPLSPAPARVVIYVRTCPQRSDLRTPFPSSVFKPQCQRPDPVLFFDSYLSLPCLSFSPSTLAAGWRGRGREAPCAVLPPERSECYECCRLRRWALHSPLWFGPAVAYPIIHHHSSSNKPHHPPPKKRRYHPPSSKRRYHPRAGAGAGLLISQQQSATVSGKTHEPRRHENTMLRTQHEHTNTRRYGR